jgi:hypothetical protein
MKSTLVFYRKNILWFTSGKESGLLAMIMPRGKGTINISGKKKFSMIFKTWIP